MNSTDICCKDPVDSGPEPLPARYPDADVSEGDLLGRLSHEMRTPLSAIVGYAQLMQAGTPPAAESQQRSIALILSAGWQLEELINLAGELGALQSGSLSLSLAPVSLADAMRDCQAFIDARPRLRGVAVRFSGPEPSCAVLADNCRLQQVLGHLMFAAVDSGDGGGAILVECDASSAEWIRFRIHAFAPTPLHAAGRRERESVSMETAGISVLVARHLVESMRGRFCASGTPAAGNIFSFELRRVPIPLANRTTPIQSALDSPDGGSARELHSKVHAPESYPTIVG